MSTTVFAIAFAAGVLSFLSPCIIPMLGVYFSLITGLTVSELKDSELDATLRRRYDCNDAHCHSESQTKGTWLI